MNEKIQNYSLSTLLSRSLLLYIPVSIFTGGMYLSTIGTEKTLATSSIPAESANLGNGKSVIVAMVSRPEFLADYPPGTELCFNDRSVENKVRIVDFNQSFQVVDFIYLDGGYQGQKGSAGYSTFVYNSYPCSY